MGPPIAKYTEHFWKLRFQKAAKAQPLLFDLGVQKATPNTFSIHC
jgi:hypothetical protein